ncbi:MAG: 16S rRNA (cytosine(967)-C(5))-methyltransferase RsmB [Acidiferrobacterales bacterium]
MLLDKKINTKTRSSPRALAALIVDAVCHHQQQLDDALYELFSLKLDEKLKPIIHELAYGTMRWVIQLQWLTTQLLDKPIRKKDRLIQALILVGLYELRFMRTASHASVNETVAAAAILDKPWSKNLVNACLRQYIRSEQDFNTRISGDLVLQQSHPQWLIDSIKKAWPDQWQTILSANNSRPPMGLRVNKKLTDRFSYISQLNEAGIENSPMPGSGNGILLSKPVPVSKLPGFETGLVTVQDGAAQLAAILLDLHAQQTILDACCAPGGKLAHILETIPENANATGLDISRARLNRVKENLQRLRLNCTLIQADVSNIDGKKEHTGQPDKKSEDAWFGKLYDRILLDAPCSATGVIRRHPDIKHHRQPLDVAKVTVLQAKILNSLWPLLASGGKLVYVTCSILPVENDEQMDKFLQTHADASILQPSEMFAGKISPENTLAAKELAVLKESVIAKSFGCQILPGTLNMDGFYYACLKKIKI